MKKIIALVTIAFVSISVQAQTTDKSKKLLDEVAAKTKSYKNMVLDFTFNSGKQNTKGTAIIQGEKYHASFMGITQIFDGTKMYIINPTDEEVTISSSKNGSSQSVSIANLLSFYKKGYTYKWDKQQTVSGKSIQYIKLLPTNSKDVKEIILGIDTKTKNIYNRTDILKNGGKTVITVNSFKTNQTLSKNQFTFTKSKYPNYYINNLD